MASRSRALGSALAVTAVAVALLFAASTWGLAALSQSRAPRDTGVVALPVTVENVPPSVGTTAEYGPVGTVSMVYAGTDVEQGLTGTVDHPWVAIAGRTGDYRAISAPALPEPGRGAVALSPDGANLAWATGEGIEIYDATSDEARERAVDGGVAHVGAFSPDGSMVTVDADGLAVVELGSGEVVARAEGTDEDVVTRSAWRADSSGVDYVADGQVVTVPTDGTEPTTQPSPFEGDVRIAWAPTGERVVAVEDREGVLRLVSAAVDGQGRLGRAEKVDTSGIALHQMIGFSGDDTVAVSAYLLESGNVERILDVSLDGRSPVDLTTLPPEGRNWTGTQTLAASADALRSGSTDFGSHTWPWSYRARLAACVLAGLFGLGLWLTRRRRQRRRRRARATAG